jgi:tetratricopeptide (TPR) repeat protein
MEKKTAVLFIIIAGLMGFIVGFIIANYLNRSDIASLRARNDGAALGTQPTTGAPVEPTLSPEEIKTKIAEADKNPENFLFQKDLGLALYRYGAMRQDADILEQARLLLDRAMSLNARDFDVVVGLGNAEFDIGYYKKDAASFQKAREIYAKALAIRPDDADVQTDLGLTYFLQDPPAYDRAEIELKKVGAKNPRHERSLQFLVQVHTRQNRGSDARAALEKLKSLNPANPAIRELTTLVSAVETPAS